MASVTAALGVGELRIKKGGTKGVDEIVGSFLQVRPDKVVVMAKPRTSRRTSTSRRHRPPDAKPSARSKAGRTNRPTSPPLRAQFQQALLQIRRRRTSLP